MERLSAPTFDGRGSLGEHADLQFDQVVDEVAGEALEEIPRPVDHSPLGAINCDGSLGGGLSAISKPGGGLKF